MNLIQQLADYQNAPIESLEAAKRGANPQISPWVAGAILSDRIEKQKRMAMGQGAAQGPQPTVSDQQDQEVAGIMGALNAPQAQPAQQAQPEPVMAAEGGLMDADVDPSMFDFCGGGIIAFDEGGEAKSKEKTQEEKDRETLSELWELIKGANRNAGAAIADVAMLPIRGLAGAYDTAVVRPMRAAGLDAGYLSKHLVPEGVDPSSMTPYYDKYARGAEPKPAPKEESKAAPKQKSHAELAAEYEKALADGRAGASPSSKPAPPAQPAPAKAAPAAAPSGIMASGAVQKALTTSPEWATLEEARKREFEAPEMAKTPGELAAEREAHLKAQGITKKPWDLAAEQTAELRRIMGQETADRAAKREADLGRPTYRRIIENMGAGSFGQSGAAGTRANRKYQDEMDAEDQRIKELNYNRTLKLNEIDAKAQELRYNEATGDVAAAQKNRQELAKLKREAQKDQAAVAQVQATQRQLAAAHDAQNATTLAAARERIGASGALTPKQIADIRDKAYDNIQKQFDAKGIGGLRLQQAKKKDPQLFDRMVQEETDRLLAAYTGSTMPAPSATGAGGKAHAKWGQAQVVK